MPKKRPAKQPASPKHDESSGYECELECARKGSFREFVGPVKIILLETPPEVYKKNILVSSLVAATYVFLGIQFMIAALFTFNYALPLKYNGHIFYCTSAVSTNFTIYCYLLFISISQFQHVNEVD